MRRLFYISCALQTWQRPTLPRLKTKYHGRRGVSRPCSERERVQPPRHNHQVGKAQLCCFEKLAGVSLFSFFEHVFRSLPAADACGTHTGQRPSPIVWRAVRSAIGASGQRSGSSAGQTLRVCREMSIVNENDQADRAISTGKLHALPHFHTRPINVVVFHGSDREYSFSGGFPA